jgi:hypothetical protein
MGKLAFLFPYIQQIHSGRRLARLIPFAIWSPFTSRLVTFVQFSAGRFLQPACRRNVQLQLHFHLRPRCPSPSPSSPSLRTPSGCRVLLGICINTYPRFQNLEASRLAVVLHLPIYLYPSCFSWLVMGNTTRTY